MIARRGGSRTLAAVVAALVAALLGACGAAPGINGAGSGQGGVREVNPYGGDLAAEGEPRRGGVLTLGTDREAIGFDPTKQNTNMAALAVYDSLMKLTPDGGAEPYLARSMDTADAGRTWTMGLRDGVRFSDGTPLDAAAVIFNVQRHIDTPSSPGNRFATQIASMRAVDPLTVEFALKAPFGAFPAVFAQSFTTGNLGSIVSPTAVRREGAGIAAKPVGAGPFVLSQWTRDSKMVLTRNPNYWQQGKPYLDGLEFRPLPDTESRYASIENGDVDVVFGGYHTELVRGLSNPNLSVYYGPGNGAEYLYFNHKSAPFDDRRMREAIVRGIDLNALAATQFRGQMERADAWFGSSSPYRTPEASGAWPTFDPEKARQLVREHVAAGGSATISYKTTNAPNRVAFAEFLQAQLAAIGITLKPQFFDLAQYSSSVVQARDFQLAGWVGGPTDAAFPPFGNLFASKGNQNYGNYANPRVDQLIQAAAATTDEGARARAYQQAQLLTNQDVAVAYYSRGYLSTITKPQVKGVVRYLTRDQFFATTWVQR